VLLRSSSSSSCVVVCCSYCHCHCHSLTLTATHSHCHCRSLLGVPTVIHAHSPSRILTLTTLTVLITLSHHHQTHLHSPHRLVVTAALGVLRLFTECYEKKFLVSELLCSSLLNVLQEQCTCYLQPSHALLRHTNDSKHIWEVAASQDDNNPAKMFLITVETVAVVLSAVIDRHAKLNIDSALAMPASLASPLFQFLHHPDVDVRSRCSRLATEECLENCARPSLYLSVCRSLSICRSLNIYLCFSVYVSLCITLVYLSLCMRLPSSECHRHRLFHLLYGLTE
jgi:hypothetical protein